MNKLYNYIRRQSSVVNIGTTPLGDSNPIRVQSMTNTSTLDTEACVEQAIRIIERGGEYVRLTAQGVREAENLANISSSLREKGYTTPLVADIHFNPKAADAAALYVEKVRINPGNYVDSARTFKEIDYTDESYAVELQKIKERFVPFLKLCRENNTAIRIGVNHGSLSDRIMSRYGNTPEGMVESSMEFLRLCCQESFTDVVLSIKSSNTVVMVKTVRLLVEQMNKENMSFPLHLGVTEAGDGEDGRIKSAIGIGALLSDGLGDTLRVSLSEAPEVEIPVAKKLVEYIVARTDHSPIVGPENPKYDSYDNTDRPTHAVGICGGKHLPIVIADYSNTTPENLKKGLEAEYQYIGMQDAKLFSHPNLIADALNNSVDTSIPLYYNCQQLELLAADTKKIKFLKVQLDDIRKACEEKNALYNTLSSDNSIILIAQPSNINIPGDYRALALYLQEAELTNPLIFNPIYSTDDAELLQVMLGSDTGANLMDGLINGLMVSNKGTLSSHQLTQWAFGALQAARRRTTKTEFISCPGCGRTLFDLEQTIAKVKAATSHLKGLKIGIMGCIVNGPGEMADADYGYVGAARNKISLYKGKVCIEKNIPEEDAVEKLIKLIKDNGDWKEPNE